MHLIKMNGKILFLMLVFLSIELLVFINAESDANQTPSDSNFTNITDDSLNNLTILSQEILFKNFFPKDFKIGDVQFNIQVQNKKNEGLSSLIALVTGRGFSTYDVFPVDLEPDERGYILVSGNFRESGVITLKIIIENNVFYQNVSVIDGKNATELELEKLKNEEEQRNLLMNLSNQIEELKDNYNALELELEQKAEENFDVSKISLNDLKSYIRSAESAILEENADKVSINLKLAFEEYETQKNKLDNVKPKSIINRIRENALIFSTIAGALITFFTLYELLKRKSENVVTATSKVIIKKNK